MQLNNTNVTQFTEKSIDTNTTAKEEATSKPTPIRDLITKYGTLIKEQQKTRCTMNFHEPGSTAKSDSKFVHGFDSITSFPESARFIEDWIRRKKHSPANFKSDLPLLMETALLIRAIQKHVETLSPSADKENTTSEKQASMPAEKVQIFSQKLNQSEQDFTFNFLINLLEACSQRFKVPTLIC